MVAEAERFKSDDERHRAAVEARDGLEGYVAHVRTVTTDPKLSAKLSAQQITRLNQLLTAVAEWLNAPQPSAAAAAPATPGAAAPAPSGLLPKAEYEKKQRELEVVAAPLIDLAFGSTFLSSPLPFNHRFTTSPASLPLCFVAVALGKSSKTEDEDDKENSAPTVASPSKPAAGAAARVTTVVASPAPALLAKAAIASAASDDADLD
jgi:hypothetical protein